MGDNLVMLRDVEDLSELLAGQFSGQGILGCVKWREHAEHYLTFASSVSSWWT